MARPADDRSAHSTLALMPIAARPSLSKRPGKNDDPALIGRASRPASCSPRVLYCRRRLRPRPGLRDGCGASFACGRHRAATGNRGPKCFHRDRINSAITTSGPSRTMVAWAKPPKIPRASAPGMAAEGGKSRAATIYGARVEASIDRYKRVIGGALRSRTD